MTDFFYALVSLSWHASLLIACAWLLCRLSRSRAAWVRPSYLVNYAERIVAVLEPDPFS
jgi:hypothetical protein